MPQQMSGDGVGRPTDWWILGLTSDPVPQDCGELSLTASAYRQFADAVEEARRGATSLLNDPAVVNWLGKSGDAFRHAGEPFPKMLDTAADAYHRVGKAYAEAATAIGEIQKRSDALVNTAMARFAEFMTISGLPQDRARSAVSQTDRGAFDAWIENSPGSSVTPANYPRLVDTWAEIQRQRGPLEAAQRDLAAAKHRWTTTVQEATDSAHEITKLFGGSGQSSVNFGERFVAFGGDVADLNLNPATAGADLLGAEVPAYGSDPFDAASWWIGLDPAEQQWLLKNRPDLLGVLDGLPFTVRDQANRALMDTDQAQLTAELKQLQAGHIPAGMDPMSVPGEINRIERNLQGIDDIKKREAAFAGKNPPVPFYVLSFDTEGAGHAAFCIGDPTTAKNIAVTVPGTGTDLGWAGTYIDLTDKTRVEANGIGGPDGSTASIYWQGYTTPPSILPDAAFQSYADTGQGLLATFVNGIPAATNPNAHLTVLGHSYGSTVVGEAAAKSGMHPDDIMFIASPGVGVDHASDLGMDPAHVWAGHIEGDPINYSPPLDPLDWFPWDPKERYGTDPTDSSFGGREFWCQNNPLNPSNHMAYWDDGSSSLHNMAAIISNHPDKLWGPTQIETPGPFPAKPFDPRREV